MSLFYYGSTNFLRQKRSANCEIRSFFCFYTLPSSSASNRNSDSNRSLSDSNRSLSDSNRNLSDSNRNLSDSNRNAVLPLLAAHCFPCLQLTASLACSSLLPLIAPHCFTFLSKVFPLKSFSGSKLSMLFCRNLNIKTYFCMRKDQLMSPERTSLAHDL